jgi:hypothetical protein
MISLKKSTLLFTFVPSEIALLLGVPIFQRPLFCRRNARGPHPGRRLEVRGDVRKRPRIPLPRPLRRRPRPQADPVKRRRRAIRPCVDRRRRSVRAAWAIAPECKEAGRREPPEIGGYQIGTSEGYICLQLLILSRVLKDGRSLWRKDRQEDRGRIRGWGLQAAVRCEAERGHGGLRCDKAQGYPRSCEKAQDEGEEGPSRGVRRGEAMIVVPKKNKARSVYFYRIPRSSAAGMSI